MSEPPLAAPFSDVLDSLAKERFPSHYHPLVIITDEKKEYAHVIQHWELYRNQDQEHRMAHIQVNSHLPRTYDNPLFASNYLDREIRKDQANHHRETSCFSRNVANGMSRLACYLVHHNYRKKYLIKAPVGDRRVHAEAAGIDGMRVKWALKKMFTRRVFLTRIQLPGTLERIWKKSYPTPLKTKPEYLPAFALG